MPPDEEAVQSWVDRRSFVELVGVHNATVTTWIREGVLSPRVGVKDGHRIQLFSTDDVTLGKGLIALLRRRHGELKLNHAVRIIEGELAQPDAGHDPQRTPPPL